MSLIQKIKVFPQYCIPQHWISQLAGRFADSTTHPLRHWVIKRFADYYQVDMSIAERTELSAYASFNDFFTRALRADARPVCQTPNTLVSPADACISQLGSIQEGRIIQAKKHDYSVSALLGGDTKLAQLFHQGAFCTLYLSPRDYHRFHMPYDGQLQQMIHVPGRLFSVNPTTAETIPGLFARNERVVCLYETDFGPMAVIAVGATIVGSIEMVWLGVVTPPSVKAPVHSCYKQNNMTLKKGEEMGRFRLGSTIILLLPPNKYTWQASLKPGESVQMGQPLVELN